MKKALPMALMLAASAPALAYDYPYLTVHTAEGQTVALSVEQLELTIADGKLVAINKQGEQTFELGALDSMYFSAASGGGAVGIASVNQNSTGVDAYSMSGIHMGHFSSLTEAQSQLRQGVYVMKLEGKTIKMTVK